MAIVHIDLVDGMDDLSDIADIPKEYEYHLAFRCHAFLETTEIFDCRNDRGITE